MRQRFPLTRRSFLSALGMGALSLCLPGDREGATCGGDFLSAYDDAGGRHFITGFSQAARKQFRLEVPQRMHGMARNPARPQQAVFFARRPGTDIYDINLHSRTVTHQLSSRPGRHFCGHGCFSRDGRYLFVSENDYEKNQGVISVRDATTLVVLEEWRSFGMDPHEIRLLDQGATLAIANGGILTRPDRPGVNLDPEGMQPSLVYLDSADGKMRDEFRLHDRQLSIRHIDVDNKDRVAIALQYEGAKENRVPLLASHSGEDALQLFADDACDWRRLNHYTGSIKFADGGDVAAVSSPRGNCLGFWNMTERKMLVQHSIHDICGVGYDVQNRNFIATTGTGGVYHFDTAGHMLAAHITESLSEIRWDNHLLTLG